jgi:hypothetical protein
MAEKRSMARAVPQKTITQNRTPLAVPSKTESPSPGNFAVEWKPTSNGAGELTIAYEGPLADRHTEEVFARFGIWREGGTPWSETREVQLRRENPGRCVGLLRLPAGAPLRAVELAVRAGEDAWDNGGRAPLGYYEWRVGDKQLAVM